MVLKKCMHGRRMDDAMISGKVQREGIVANSFSSMGCMGDGDVFPVVLGVLLELVVASCASLKPGTVQKEPFLLHCSQEGYRRCIVTRCWCLKIESGVAVEV